MTERERIENLRQKYLSLKENTPMMKRDGEECKAYHEWYDNAYVFFKSFDYLQDDSDFNVFINAQKEGNCFVLEHIYDTISPSYKVLMAKIANTNMVKPEMAKATRIKVFISHSSADEAIITKFVENVLRLGLGVSNEEIAFTSHEVYGVEAGDSIIEYIKTNIINPSVVLLMISDNYKKSEVCLNEMGAAWAHGKKSLSVVLPNTGFDKLGWLSSFEKAERIDDKKQLLALCSKIAKLLGIDINEKFVSAGTYVDKFLNEIGGLGIVANKVNTKGIEMGDADSVVMKAINRLGEFTFKDLQDETGFKDSAYLMQKINALVSHGDLKALGPKTNRKYRIKVK